MHEDRILRDRYSLPREYSSPWEARRNPTRTRLERVENLRGTKLRRKGKEDSRARVFKFPIVCLVDREKIPHPLEAKISPLRAQQQQRFLSCVAPRDRLFLLGRVGDAGLCSLLLLLTRQHRAFSSSRRIDERNSPERKERCSFPSNRETAESD